MSALTLAEAARACGGVLAGGADPQAVVRAVTVDSRQVRAGTLFAAFAGEHADGHDFASAAVAAGAVAVLASREVTGPRLVVPDVTAALAQLARAQRDQLTQTRVIAVTGSAGKTTTKDLLAELLAELGPTVAAPGSFNNDIGTPLTILAADPTTRFLVLEMGARGAGHIARLAELARPQVGVVLNVGSAHLGEFGSQAGIAAAKGELAAAASEYAVLSADDPWVAAMAPRVRGAVVWVSAAGRSEADQPRADLAATDIRLDDDGRASFRLIAGGAQPGVPVALRLVGAHQVGNALAAAAVALREGLGLTEVARVLSAAEPRSRWRMEVGRSAAGVLVINDAYNANPESMTSALETLARMSAARAGRSVAVLGEMRELGERSASLHEQLGRVVAKLAIDQLMVVGDGARSLHLGACADSTWNGESVWVPNGADAVGLLRALLRPDDVVLVKASRAAGLELVAEALLTGGVAA